MGFYGLYISQGHRGSISRVGYVGPTLSISANYTTLHLRVIESI